MTHISNGIRETRVAKKQPATRGDPIGLVLELLRVHLIEVTKPVNIIPQTKLGMRRGQDNIDGGE